MASAAEVLWRNYYRTVYKGPTSGPEQTLSSLHFPHPFLDDRRYKSLYRPRSILTVPTEPSASPTLIPENPLKNMSRRQWPQPPMMPTAQETGRANVPNWMLEPYDYPQSSHSRQPDAWEITKARNADDYVSAPFNPLRTWSHLKYLQHKQRRREEKSQRRYDSTSKLVARLI